MVVSGKEHTTVTGMVVGCLRLRAHNSHRGTVISGREHTTVTGVWLSQLVSIALAGQETRGYT